MGGNFIFRLRIWLSTCFNFTSGLTFAALRLFSSCLYSLSPSVSTVSPVKLASENPLLVCSRKASKIADTTSGFSSSPRLPSHIVVVLPKNFIYVCEHINFFGNLHPRLAELRSAVALDYVYFSCCLGYAEKLKKLKKIRALLFLGNDIIARKNITL